MEGKNRPLPIGSVVILKGANTKMMILGYLKYGGFDGTVSHLQGQRVL